MSVDWRFVLEKHFGKTARIYRVRAVFLCVFFASLIWWISVVFHPTREHSFLLALENTADVPIAYAVSFWLGAFAGRQIKFGLMFALTRWLRATGRQIDCLLIRLGVSKSDYTASSEDNLSLTLWRSSWEVFSAFLPTLLCFTFARLLLNLAESPNQELSALSHLHVYPLGAVVVSSVFVLHPLVYIQYKLNALSSKVRDLADVKRVDGRRLLLARRSRQTTWFDKLMMQPESSELYKAA